MISVPGMPIEPTRCPGLRTTNLSGWPAGSTRVRRFLLPGTVDLEFRFPLRHGSIDLLEQVLGGGTLVICKGR